MTISVRRGLASSILGTLGLVLAGCGGGGGGASVPTATPLGTPGPTTTGTPSATSTPVPGTGATRVTASEIVFVSNRLSTSDLYKSNLDGSNPVRLTSLGRAIDKPSVSPDGTRIVFQFDDTPTDGNANSEIGIINVNGSNFRALTTDNTASGRPDDYSPVWSSDGRSIYWTSTRQATNETGQTVDRVPHIFRMEGVVGSEGLNPTQVIREASAYPSAARLDRIAYVATGQTNLPVAIANATTGALIQRVGQPLTTGQVAFGVALSPDATRAAYSIGGGTGSTFTSIEISNVATNQRSVIAGNASSRVGNWSRDSQTLFFDSATSATSQRQIFSATATGQSQTRLPQQQAGSDNYSPAFLSG